MKWGQDLIDFQIRLTAVEQISSVNVRSWDRKKKEAITSKKDKAKETPIVGVQSSGADAAKKAFGESEGFVTDRPVTTVQEADYLAQSVFNEVGNSFIQAEGTCRQGSPRVSAGAWIKLADIGKHFSGRYLVTRAVHRYERGDYEVRFEVSGRRANTLAQLLATENNHHHGVVVGVVTNVNDPDNLGRVKVKFPSLSEDLESWWARLVSPMAGEERGMEFIPEVDDEVLVAFEHNNINYPYILGALWNEKDKPPLPGNEVISGGKVQKRVIRSATGHKILFDDTANKEKITIVDKTGNNLVNIDSASNKLEIKAGKEIEVYTDDGHKIVLNSSGITIEAATGKDITLKGNKVKIDAQMGVDMKASAGEVKVEGLTTTVKGTTKLDVDSPTTTVKGTAMLTLQGALVKIN